MALGSWTALLLAYLLGGITFIPLIIIAVCAHGYLYFPYRADVGISSQDGEGDIILPDDDTTTLDTARAEMKADTKPRLNQDIDVASGYFAVYREYNPAGINAKPVERPTPIASTTVAAPSPSVYQTMYRSIFDRKPTAGPLDNSNNRMAQRPKKAGNVFYVVLRHGHLMLFDDEEQLEVRHVISLAHHDISIYSGEETIPEGELFIKRNALCLSRRHDGSDRSPDGQVSKPFFMFSENCSAKEDFYFALLKNQQQAFGFDNMAPKPKHFELKSIISLVQKLHSSEDQVHSRWLNAMIGRLFLGVYKTSDLSSFINEKITKKIARVKRPSFLTNIKIQKIETGDSPPYISNLRLRDLTVEGECLVEADLRYTGNFRIEVAATAKIDLGTRFKTREVNLVLAVVLKRLEGHILFKIKAPPSNRVWFSFQTMPKLEMVIEPIVSSRQITYTVITRQIENRIKEVIAETLRGIFDNDDAVKPPSKEEDAVKLPAKEEDAAKPPAKEDDVVKLPSREDDAVEPPSKEDEATIVTGSVDSVEPPNIKKDYGYFPLIDKSEILQIPRPQQPPSGLLGRKPGKFGAFPTAWVSSTSVDIPPSGFSAPSRSPNIIKSSTEPVLGTEATHADIFKPATSPPDHASSYMAALHSRSQDLSPKPASPTSPSKRSSPVPSPSRSSSSSKEEIDDLGGYEPNSLPTHPTLRRNTTSSAESSLNERSLAEGESAAQKRSNTLAAVTSAAAQAKQWGWNALQRQREAMRNGDKASVVDLSQPMGRGQPLPPPGTPLPGPNSGRTKIMPAPNSRAVVSSELGIPISAASSEAENQTRAALSKSSSNRRRRGDSHNENLSDEQNILIVAAPQDSQPSTPTGEDRINQVEPWNGDIGTKASLDTMLDEESSFSTQPDALVEHSPGVKYSSIHDVPIVAMPSLADTSIDDDDYSGWMSDINLDEDNNHE
ncbi:Nucleus-vacuole junction protein 2 [Cladobotryum mycophilum]|uniref:Nucleus-vacuole junction protein 2 n=1 Tax=Cladobotryum mycophilum TaxID=491253 RepID=A0ABR0T4G4_9HYPO